MRAVDASVAAICGVSSDDDSLPLAAIAAQISGAAVAAHLDDETAATSHAVLALLDSAATLPRAALSLGTEPAPPGASSAPALLTQAKRRGRGRGTNVASKCPASTAASTAAGDSVRVTRRRSMSLGARGTASEQHTAKRERNCASMSRDSNTAAAAAAATAATAAPPAATVATAATAIVAAAVSAEDGDDVGASVGASDAVPLVLPLLLPPVALQADEMVVDHGLHATSGGVLPPPQRTSPDIVCTVLDDRLGPADRAMAQMSGSTVGAVAAPCGPSQTANTMCDLHAMGRDPSGASVAAAPATAEAVKAKDVVAQVPMVHVWAAAPAPAASAIAPMQPSLPLPARTSTRLGAHPLNLTRLAAATPPPLAGAGSSASTTGGPRAPPAPANTHRSFLLPSKNAVVQQQQPAQLQRAESSNDIPIVTTCPMPNTPDAEPVPPSFQEKLAAGVVTNSQHVVRPLSGAMNGRPHRAAASLVSAPPPVAQRSTSVVAPARATGMATTPELPQPTAAIAMFEATCRSVDPAWWQQCAGSFTSLSDSWALQLPVTERDVQRLRSLWAWGPSLKAGLNQPAKQATATVLPDVPSPLHALSCSSTTSDSGSSSSSSSGSSNSSSDSRGASGESLSKSALPAAPMADSALHARDESVPGWSADVDLPLAPCAAPGDGHHVLAAAERGVSPQDERDTEAAALPARERSWRQAEHAEWPDSAQRDDPDVRSSVTWREQQQQQRSSAATQDSSGHVERDRALSPERRDPLGRPDHSSARGTTLRDRQAHPRPWHQEDGDGPEASRRPRSRLEPVRDRDGDSQAKASSDRRHDRDRDSEYVSSQRGYRSISDRRSDRTRESSKRGRDDSELAPRKHARDDVATDTHRGSSEHRESHRERERDVRRRLSGRRDASGVAGGAGSGGGAAASGGALGGGLRGRPTADKDSYKPATLHDGLTARQLSEMFCAEGGIGGIVFNFSNTTMHEVFTAGRFGTHNYDYLHNVSMNMLVFFWNTDRRLLHGPYCRAGEVEGHVASGLHYENQCKFDHVGTFPRLSEAAALAICTPKSPTSDDDGHMRLEERLTSRQCSLVLDAFEDAKVLSRTSMVPPPARRATHQGRREASETAKHPDALREASLLHEPRSVPQDQHVSREACDRLGERPNAAVGGRADTRGNVSAARQDGIESRRASPASRRASPAPSDVPVCPGHSQARPGMQDGQGQGHSHTAHAALPRRPGSWATSATRDPTTQSSDASQLPAAPPSGARQAPYLLFTAEDRGAGALAGRDRERPQSLRDDDMSDMSGVATALGSGCAAARPLHSSVGCSSGPLPAPPASRQAPYSIAKDPLVLMKRSTSTLAAREFAAMSSAERAPLQLTERSKAGLGPGHSSRANSAEGAARSDRQPSVVVELPGAGQQDVTENMSRLTAEGRGQHKDSTRSRGQGCSDKDYPAERPYAEQEQSRRSRDSSRHPLAGPARCRADDKQAGVDSMRAGLHRGPAKERVLYDSRPSPSHSQGRDASNSNTTRAHSH